MTGPSFKTVAGRVRFEPAKTKGSRHIATVLPITSEDCVAAAIAAARREFPTANHHAYAWRLGVDRARFRYSDDGEPSGSAGKPILQQIDRFALTRVAVIVSRVFGGTKLGTGGLVRAYGGAARAALERAEIVERVLTAAVTITHEYDLAGAVQAVLHEAGLTPRHAEYDAKTRLVVDVPAASVEAFVSAVRDATKARARCDVEMPDDD